MFARTERLLLRPGWAEDAPALATAIGDEAILRNLATAPSPYRPTDAAAFLARPQDPAHPAVLILARTLGAPRLIGSIGLHPSADGNALELGYWIARRHWGLGYATEAGRAIVAFAREGLRASRLVASHFVDNPASGHVLTKLGFRQTGRIASRPTLARAAAALCVGYALDLASASEHAMAA